MKKWIVLIWLNGVAIFAVGCEPFQAKRISPLDVSSINDQLGTAQPMVKITSVSIDSMDASLLIVVGICTNSSKVQLYEGDPSNALEFTCSNGGFSKQIHRSSGDGAKSVYAVAVFGSQQSADSNSIVIDTVAPTIQLVTPVDGSEFQSQLQLTGTCEVGLPLLISGDVASPIEATCSSSGTFSESLALAGNDGIKNVKVSQTDKSKNTSQVSRSFVRDMTAPKVAITEPAANATVASTALVKGTCETGLVIEVSSSGNASKSQTSCAQGKFSIEVPLSSGNGQKQLMVTQTDKAGNVGSDARSVNKQAIGPQILITEPAALAPFKSTLALKGSCQANVPVQISGAGVASSSSVACSSGSFSTNVILSDQDGSKPIRVSQVDSNGVEGADIRTFIRDNAAPAIKLLEPSAQAITKGLLTLQGTCETGIPVVIWGAGASKTYGANCVSNAFSIEIELSAADGSKEVRVSQTDAASNVGTDIRSFVRDTTPPVIQITSPTAGASVQTSPLALTGTCETGRPLQISGTGVKSAVSANCTSGAFNVSVALTDGDGQKALMAEQTDIAGNKGSLSLTVIKTTPTPTLDGKILYANNCAGCHGPLDSSVKKGKSALEITNAIFGSNGSAGVGSMSGLKSLSSAEINAISQALAVSSVPVNQAKNPFECVNPASAPVQATDTSRLSKLQLMNTYKSLLGSSIYSNISSEFAGIQPDAEVLAQVYTSEEVAALKQIATKAASAIVANSTNLKAVVGDCAATALNETCARQFIDSFGLKALRRPPTATEKTALVDIFKGHSVPNDGIKGIVLYLLQAPQFVFHIEVGADNDTTPAGSAFKLTQFELASRISYLLTDTMPDATLFQMASAGQLSGSQINTQIDRLLLSTDGKAKIRKFYDSYLKLEPITQLGNYPAEFLAGLDTNGLATEMQRELDQFIETMVFTEKAGFEAFMTSKRSFARTPAMAQIYGHSLASSSTAVQTMGGDRKGILMRAPMLLSYDVITHPILRGVRIQRNILCEEIGDPPSKLENPDAPANLDLATYSTRDFYKHKTNSSSCLGCHSKINPAGFLLEGYDSLGRLQATETRYDDMGRKTRTFPIVTEVDPFVIEAGAPSSFKTAAEFADALATSQRGPTCFVKQAFRYYQKRKESASDACSLQPMYQKVIGSSGSMLESIRSGINNNNLQYRVSKP